MIARVSLVVLIAVATSACSIIDGLGLAPVPPDGALTCNDAAPYCADSDYLDVCDTYGTEIDDGDDGVRTFACVEPAQVNQGPCADVWDQLSTQPSDDARILWGSYIANAVDDGPIGRRFVGTLVVLHDDPERTDELLSLSSVDLAVVDSGIIAQDGYRAGIVSSAVVDEGITTVDGASAVKISFHWPDPTTQSAPSAVAAMITFDDESTTHRRCLDVE